MERNIWISIATGFPQIITFIVLIVLFVAAWRNRNEIGWARIFLFVIISIGIWDVADFLEIFSSTYEYYKIINEIAYIGIATLPLFWFLFIVRYVGNEAWMKPFRVGTTAFIPVLTIIFIFTNDYHHLMRTVTAFDGSGQFYSATVDYGPWFWVHSVNSYIFLLLATFLLIRSAVKNSGLVKSQKIFLILSCWLPWAANIIYLVRITDRDFTASAFTIFAGFLAIDVFRFQLFNLAPIARDIVVENISDAVIVLNHQNKIIDFNPSAGRLFTTNPSSVLGQTLFDVFPDFKNIVQEFVNQDEINTEISVPEDKPRHYFSVQISPIRKRNSFLMGKVIVLHDISEQKNAQIAIQKLNQELEDRVTDRTIELKKELEKGKRTETALRESEERYSLAVQGANDGIWDWNLQTEEVYFSPRWKSMVGLDEYEVIFSIENWFEIVHPDDRAPLKIEISRHLDGLTTFFQFTHRVIRKDGSLIWILSRGLASRDNDGIAHRLSGSFTDITQSKEYEEQILHNAFHDTLTGLPNRAFFMERLTHSINRAKRNPDENFAILFLDLDRFKNINDSLGHGFGDKLLIQCGERLLQCIRNIDLVARLGGDEFVVLIDSINGVDDAISIAQRINKDFASSFLINSTEISISCSIGIVQFSNQYDKAEEILRDADITMYQAKSNGTARYEIFTMQMREQAYSRLEIETNLRRALDHNEFELYYQPIIQLNNKKLSSFEALIRWNQPEKGLVLPADFIPIAEETGLIIPIGQWVLREACQQIQKWKKMSPSDYHLSISVNLSAKQFVDPHLLTNIENCLNDFNIEKGALVIEITESAIIEDTQTVILTLTKLRSMGVKVNIDDFGTGYSSLSYLNNLPIDALKIDRSFIQKMFLKDNNTGSDIIQTMIELGKDLGISVVAEGVETAEEMQRLSELECGFIQGFLIAKPLSKKDAEEFLLAQIKREVE